MTYRTDIVDDNTVWDALVRTSPQGNLFCQSRYLQAIGMHCERFAVRSESGELLAGAIVPLQDGSAVTGTYPFCPYQGVLLAPKIAAKPAHKRYAQAFGIVEVLIEGLCERHEQFSLALSPALEDLRPFLWHNYHLPSGARFSVANRYTAILDLSHFDKNHYLSSIRSSRRQEWHKSQARIESSTDIEHFSELYQLTFERQNIKVPEKQIQMLRQLAERSLQREFGWMSAARLPNGKIASMTLFVEDGRTAYYLAAANNPDSRGSGASTRLMIENIAEAARRGCMKLDFVGVNSPNRGDFKLSFNPGLAPYAEVTLKSVTEAA